MKKRVLAVLLSLTMCMATVVEAGAAAFSSSPTDGVGTVAEAAEESAEAAPAEIEEPAVTVEPKTEETEQNVDAGLFTSGDNTVQDGTENQQIAEEQQVTEDQTVVNHAAVEEGNLTTVAGSIKVTEDSWMENAGHFFLEKPAAESGAQTSTEETTEEAQETATGAEAEVPEETSGAELTQELTIDEETAAAGETTSAEPAVELQTAETEMPEVVEEPETTVVPETVAEPAQEETKSIEDTENVPDAETSTEPQEGMTVDPAKYYTLADGIVSITTTYNGKTYNGNYLFDEKGMMVTGAAMVKTGTKGYSLDTDQELFFIDAASAVMNEGCENETVTPWTSNLGMEQKNTWVWTGTVFQFYDEAGKLVSVDTLNDTAKAEGTYTGYFKINDEYYCLQSDGTPRTGNITLTVGTASASYYFQTAEESSSTIPGKMFHNGWRTFTGSKGERWIYYDLGDKVPADIGKAQEHGIVATQLDTSIKGDSTYLIDKYGYLIKSTMKKSESGAYYCTDKNGVIYKAKLVKYNGVRYYFGDDGKRASWTKCWHTCPGAGSHMYYFGTTAGRIVEKTGWQKVTTAAGSFYGWFYFNTSGNNYMNKLTSTGYYFNSKGKLASGINTIDGKKYFFEVSDATTHRGKMIKSSLIYHKSKWYYASATGVLRKSGWQKVSGSWYYFDNYRAVTKKFIQKGTTYGYLNSQGKFCTGWVIISNSQNLVRYINPDAPGFLKSTNRVINGLRYYFDANGYRINDLTGMYGGPYYVKVDRVNCTMTIYNSDGTVPVKSIRVSVGLAGTPTPTGTYSLARSARWQALMGPSWGQYGSHVEGAGQGGIFVHSVSGSSANSYSLPAGEYNKLGTPASHGCIRVCVADAKWVYDNCNGATITIFDGNYTANESMRGPLGRRALVPLKSPYNYDPTDPAI